MIPCAFDNGDYEGMAIPEEDRNSANGPFANVANAPCCNASGQVTTMVNTVVVLSFTGFLLVVLNVRKSNCFPHQRV